VPVQLLYLDSSALVKLVTVEAESEALRRALRRWPRRVSSVLTHVEVLRAARRSSVPEAVVRAQQILKRLDLIELDAPVRRLAADLDPPALRSLDAVHLATALSLGDDLGGFAVYDVALAEAAAAAGLEVVTPH
jgi:hypothetical protein